MQGLRSPPRCQLFPHFWCHRGCTITRSASPTGQVTQPRNIGVTSLGVILINGNEGRQLAGSSRAFLLFFPLRSDLRLVFHTAYPETVTTCQATGCVTSWPIVTNSRCSSACPGICFPSFPPILSLTLASCDCTSQRSRSTYTWASLSKNGLVFAKVCDPFFSFLQKTSEMGCMGLKEMAAAL